MRRLALITAALVLFASSSTFAQVRSTRIPGVRAPSPLLTAPASVPGTIPTLGSSPGIALGAIQPMVGTPATIAGSAMGTIAACPTTGSAASLPFNATFADPLTGALPSQPLPGATVPSPYSFGTSIMTGACNPAASTTATVEALGASTAVAIPGVATVSGPAYSDATVPSTAVEAGGAGLSPLIAVPSPAIPSPSPFAIFGTDMGP